MTRKIFIKKNWQINLFWRLWFAIRKIEHKNAETANSGYLDEYTEVYSSRIYDTKHLHSYITEYYSEYVIKICGLRLIYETD